MAEDWGRELVLELAAQIDWDRVGTAFRTPSEWFDDSDNPFEAEPAK